MSKLPLFDQDYSVCALDQIYYTAIQPYNEPTQLFLFSIDLLDVLNEILAVLSEGNDDRKKIPNLFLKLSSLIAIIYCLYKASTENSAFGLNSNYQLALVKEYLTSVKFPNQDRIIAYFYCLVSGNKNFGLMTPSQVLAFSDSSTVGGNDVTHNWEELLSVLKSINGDPFTQVDLPNAYKLDKHEEEMLTNSCNLALDETIELSIRQKKSRLTESQQKLEAFLLGASEIESESENGIDISLREHKQAISLVNNLASLDGLEILFGSRVRLLLERCPNVVKSICSSSDLGLAPAHLSTHSYNKLVSAVLTPSLIPTTTLHNSLIEIILLRPADLYTESWHKYLSAVEFTCQSQEHKGITQMHNAKLACKLFRKFLENKILKLADFKVELSSFCLSYVYVKDAVDLYAFISSAKN